MRRIAHRIFLTVCLVLTAVLLAGWLRTHLATDVICWSGAGGRYWEVATVPGQVRVTVARGWPGTAPVRWYRGVGAGPAGRAVFGHNVIRGPWFAPGFAIADRRTRVATGYAGATGTSGTKGASSATGAAGTTGTTTTTTTVLVPYRTYAAALGPMVLLFGAYPWAVAWRTVRDRRLRRERVRQGRCAACGYDLRASTGRCPECGAVADAPTMESQLQIGKGLTT